MRCRGYRVSKTSAASPMMRRTLFMVGSEGVRLGRLTTGQYYTASRSRRSSLTWADHAARRCAHSERCGTDGLLWRVISARTVVGENPPRGSAAEGRGIRGGSDAGSQAPFVG